MINVLDAILQKCRDNTHPVVLFDLDGTLFNNTPRTRAILVEFAEHTHDDDLRQKLLTSEIPYSPRELMHSLSKSDILVDEAVHYWKQRFFSNEYQYHDEAITGASEYVRELHQLGAHIVYLSGRDVPGMLIGCTKALYEQGFPIGLADTHLYLKPHFKLPDLEFKISTLDRIDRLGTLVGAFDNEPGICNALYQRWPEATMVLLDTLCAPGAPALLENISTIPNFSR